MLLNANRRKEQLELNVLPNGWRIQYIFDDSPPPPIILNEPCLCQLIQELGCTEPSGKISIVDSTAAGWGYTNMSGGTPDLAIALSLSSEPLYSYQELYDAGVMVEGYVAANLVLVHELRHVWQHKNWDKFVPSKTREEDAEEFEKAYYIKFVIAAAPLYIHYLDHFQ